MITTAACECASSSPNWTAIGMYVAAFALEVAAAVLVAIDIVRSRARAAQLEILDPDVLQIPMTVNAHGVGGMSIVEDLSAQAAHLRISKLETSVKGDIASAVDTAVAAANQRTTTVAAAINAVVDGVIAATDLKGDRRLAVRGVILLVVSIGVGTAANLSSAGLFQF